MSCLPGEDWSLLSGRGEREGGAERGFDVWLPSDLSGLPKPCRRDVLRDERFLINCRPTARVHKVWALLKKLWTCQN